MLAHAKQALHVQPVLRLATTTVMLVLVGLLMQCVVVCWVSVCRGAYDEAYVTALGPSTACTNACHEYTGADACGGQYAISLYRLDNATYDTGAGAAWSVEIHEADNSVGL